MPARLLYAFSWFFGFLNYMIIINASIAFFNLLPIPPLDGSKILFGLLPDRFYRAAQMIEQYSFILLLLLLMGSLPQMVITPLTIGLINSFVKFFALFT